MRKMFLSVALALLATGAVLAQPAVVNGTIKGHPGTPIFVAHDRIIDTIKLENGTFTLNFEVPGERSEVSFFGIGNVSVNLVAKKGQTVNFIADISAPGKETVEFTGDNVELNDYLTSYSNMTGFSAWSQEKIAGMASFKAFEAEVERMLAELQRKLDKVGEKDIKDDLRKELDLTRIYFPFRYAWATNRLAQVPLDGDPDFVRYAQSIDLNDRRILDEPQAQMSYANLVDQRLRWEAQRNPDKYAGLNSAMRYYAAISDLVSDPDVADKLATSNFEMYLALGADENIETTFEAYKQLGKDPQNLAKLDKKVKELDALSPGKMAPDFIIVDTEGNKGMLSDLRGKNIYIDIWATWCGPCVAEIPFVEKLQEKYRNSQNLEFISISVDDNVEAWKKKLEADNPAWRNFVVEGGFRGPLNQLYYISGIPRFMLIDKDGRIISVNAPRPSSENIDEYLAPYL